MIHTQHSHYLSSNIMDNIMLTSLDDLVDKRSFAASRFYIRKFLGPICQSFAMMKVAPALTIGSVLRPVAPEKPTFGIILAPQVRVVCGVLLKIWSDKQTHGDGKKGLIAPSVSKKPGIDLIKVLPKGSHGFRLPEFCFHDNKVGVIFIDGSFKLCNSRRARAFPVDFRGPLGT